jgi:hypothetical protein
MNAEGRFVTLTIISGALVFGFLRSRKIRRLFFYITTVGMMLLLALCETWIITIWQPDLFRLDLEWQRAFTNCFAFPFSVMPVRGGLLPGMVQLVILINFGSITLFRLESPTVFHGSGDMVFWFTRIRIIAFQIIFCFHLIAIFIFMLVVFLFVDSL